MSKRLDELRAKVSELCERTDVPEPGEFLASIMSGIDPRRKESSLVRIVREMNDELGDDDPGPDRDSWDFLASYVLGSGLFETEPVSLEVSYAAAKELMNYLNAKLKAIELSGDVDVNVRVVPLTDEEIERFKRVWDSKY